MKKYIVSIGILMLFVSGITPLTLLAEEYKTENGSGRFSVSAPAKVIYGESDQVFIQIDDKFEMLNLKVPVNSFQFSNNFISDSMNAAIYERFNTYYMESNRHPYVTYTAKIINAPAINLKQDGNYPIYTRGTLQVHGVEQELSSEGILKVQGGNVSVEAKIVIEPKDYDINIPDYIGNMYFKEVSIETKAVLYKVQ